MIETNRNRTTGSLLVYGDTEKYRFPLLLVMGREYHDYPSHVRTFVDSYDFAASPRHQFWNRTFSLVRRVTRRDIKPDSALNGCSPVVFSAALPLTIAPHLSQKQKVKVRARVDAKQIYRHIRAVFEQPVCDRVQLVLFSGLEDVKGMGAARRAATEACRELSRDYVEIPYLGSRLADGQLDQSLGRRAKGTIGDIVQEYYHCIHTVRPWHWPNPNPQVMGGRFSRGLLGSGIGLLDRTW